MNELIDPMEFFDKPEEHPDSEQRNTAGMGDHVPEVSSSTALPCCTSLSERKVSMGDVIKDAIDALNSIAADSAFPPASSSDYVDADAEVFEANVQGSCAPPEPAKAPSQIGSYAPGYNPLMAPNNAFGFFPAASTAPTYPLVSSTNVAFPPRMPLLGGLSSNSFGLYGTPVPPSVIHAFQSDTTFGKEERKAMLKADLETHKAGLTAQLTTQKAAIDAQRDMQRHLYRVEEQDRRTENIIRVEEAREQRREARREAALCPIEDSDGYIRIEKKASCRESEFGKRVLKWPHVRIHQIWSTRQKKYVALRLSWQTDRGRKELFLAKTTATTFVHAMEKAGNPFQCGREWKQDICEPVYSFLLERAQREALPECLGWNLVDGEWVFAWENDLTIEKVVREVENNG